MFKRKNLEVGSLLIKTEYIGLSLQIHYVGKNSLISQSLPIFNCHYLLIYSS
jgi:hypothetical protein